MNRLTDVIAAVSTPPGKGGVAIIRVCGDAAFEIAEKIFVPISKKSISDYPSRTAIYGHIIEDGEKIDDVLLTKFPAPHSYTGENTVEIGCHGGILVTRSVLEVLLRQGARAADAGEFTRRAFINGKLTLTDAEAIGNLLEARSREQIRLNSDTSRERLNEKIGNIRRGLVELMSSIYARIDYPDEDLGDFDDNEVLSRLAKIKADTENLSNTYRTGRAISEGIKTAIVGKPNVGKSTLYNALVGKDAAIVTSIPGTTRDVLEESISLGKVMLRISDTAGLREYEGMDEVERIGVKKSRKLIADCELLFAIFDVSRPFDDEDEAVIKEISTSSAAKIAILNKCDSENLFTEDTLSDYFDEVIKVSARKAESEMISSLTSLVERLFTDEKIIIGSDAIIASARQHASLTRAIDLIDTAHNALKLGFSQDAISTDIERALGAISELDGRAVSDEIVSNIFSKFCVGK